MLGLEGILASVVAPAVIDLVKTVFGAAAKRFIGVSVDDEIKLADADVRKLEAIAKVDNPYGTPSQWVIDLRASFRYIFAGILTIAGAAVLAAGLWLRDEQAVALGFNLASVPWSFIFGERMWQGFKGAGAK